MFKTKKNEKKKKLRPFPLRKLFFSFGFSAFGSFKKDLGGLLDKMYCTFYYEAYSDPSFLSGFL